MNSRFAALGLLALLALCGQANAGDELSKKDLSDEMPTVVSLAAETELFTDFVASGQSRTHFTREHAAYLIQSVRDELKKLQKKPPSQSIKTTYDKCRSDLLLLESALQRISEGPAESDVRQVHSQAQQLHQHLRALAASL
jgi:hypothetical protein